MNKLFNQLLEKRGLTEEFLRPKYENSANPFKLPDMEKAVSRLEKAIKNHEKILIYGDYDVDGITASTVMEEALKLAGVEQKNITIMLPNRFTDGYGMSPRLIKTAEKQGITLVITVDCGSRNHDIINELNFLKIDTIVTDHHETGDTLPEALAIINPKRQDFQDDKSELKNLAGVGVAFKFAQALVNKKFIPAGQEKWFLDLVLIGTICDSMLLTGENRILSYYGVKVLEKTRRKGLKELMKSAKVHQITSESIGFQIGPRLNVAGRLESAEIALNLLRTNSATEAAELTAKLEKLNYDRRKKQNEAIKEIESHGTPSDPVIIETGNYSEGILGIIASRLVESYHRPAFVLTEVEEGVLKGSARSFGDFNLAEALKNIEDIIIGGGGHAMAAGVKIKRENLYAFRERINEYYRSLNLTDQERFLRSKHDLTLTDFSDFNLELLDELKNLEPFGAGNEEPIFRLENTEIINATKMGSDQNHLRLDLRDAKNHQLKSVAFFADENWLKLTPEDQITPLIKLTLNDFNGVKSVEARLIDVIMV
jgi:single-stranded-DNA-specific exonuclease